MQLYPEHMLVSTQDSMRIDEERDPRTPGTNFLILFVFLFHFPFVLFLFDLFSFFNYFDSFLVLKEGLF